MRLAKFAGSFALFIAGMALLTFISLFVVGAYLATWPIMRVSPRSRRLTSLMELATAVMGAARAYGLDKSLTPDTDEGEEVTGEVVPDDTEATDTRQPQSPDEFTAFMNWAKRERGSFLTDSNDLTPAEVAGLLHEYRGGGE